MVVSVYMLLIGVTVSVVYSIGRMATLVPEYTADVEASITAAGAWLEDRGMGEEQVAAMTGAFDVGGLVTVASDIFGAVLGLASNLFFIVTLGLFMAHPCRCGSRARSSLRR